MILKDLLGMRAPKSVFSNACKSFFFWRKTIGEWFYLAKVNVEFFRKESPELAYILGLWASDGCIYKNTLQICMTDKDVIDWLSSTIDYCGEIKEIKNHGGFYSKTDKITSIGYFLRFHSKEIRTIFNKYGITQRKSKTIKFPNLPEQLIPHFIRGVFDGDGGIYVTKRKINGKYYDRAKVHFCSGSFYFLEGLKTEIEKVIDANCKITTGTRCYQYGFESKKDVIKFAEWIYQNDSFGMERMKNKFIELGAKIA
jgi:hypothetical protein